MQQMPLQIHHADSSDNQNVDQLMSLASLLSECPNLTISHSLQTTSPSLSQQQPTIISQPIEMKKAFKALLMRLLMSSSGHSIDQKPIYNSSHNTSSNSISLSLALLFTGGISQSFKNSFSHRQLTSKQNTQLSTKIAEDDGITLDIVNVHYPQTKTTTISQKFLSNQTGIQNQQIQFNHFFSKEDSVKVFGIALDFETSSCSSQSKLSSSQSQPSQIQPVKYSSTISSFFKFVFCDITPEFLPLPHIQFIPSCPFHGQPLCERVIGDECENEDEQMNSDNKYDQQRAPQQNNEWDDNDSNDDINRSNNINQKNLDNQSNKQLDNIKRSFLCPAHSHPMSAQQAETCLNIGMDFFPISIPPEIKPNTQSNIQKNNQSSFSSQSSSLQFGSWLSLTVSEIIPLSGLSDAYIFGHPLILSPSTSPSLVQSIKILTQNQQNLLQTSSSSFPNSLSSFSSVHNNYNNKNNLGSIVRGNINEENQYELQDIDVFETNFNIISQIVRILDENKQCLICTSTVRMAPPSSSSLPQQTQTDRLCLIRYFAAFPSERMGKLMIKCLVCAEQQLADDIDVGIFENDEDEKQETRKQQQKSTLNDKCQFDGSEQILEDDIDNEFNDNPLILDEKEKQIREAAQKLINNIPHHKSYIPSQHSSRLETVISSLYAMQNTGNRNGNDMGMKIGFEQTMQNSSQRNNQQQQQISQQSSSSTIFQSFTLPFVQQKLQNQQINIEQEQQRMRIQLNLQSKEKELKKNNNSKQQIEQDNQKSYNDIQMPWQMQNEINNTLKNNKKKIDENQKIIQNAIQNRNNNNKQISSIENEKKNYNDKEYNADQQIQNMNGIKNKRKRDEEFEDEYEIEEDGMNSTKQIEDNMDEFEDPSMNNYQSQEQSGNKGRGRGRSNRGRGSINNNGRGKSRENKGRGGKKNDFCQIQVQDNQIEMQNSNQIKISQSQHQQISSSSSSSSSPILSPQAHFLSPQNIDARPLQTSQQQTHNSKSKSKAVSRVKVQATLNEQQQRPKSRLQQSLFQQPDTPDLSSAVPVLESFDGAKQVMPRMKHALLRVENLFGYGNENSASSEMSNENLFN